MSRGGGKSDPLEALRRVRELGVDEAEAAVANAVASVEARTADVQSARADQAALAEAQVLETARQRAREDTGGSARDLSLGQAFLLRRKRELEAAAASVRAAEAQRALALAEADRAREALAGAQADAEVVGRHLERQEGAEKRARDARAEADAEDLVAARRRTTEG